MNTPATTASKPPVTPGDNINVPEPRPSLHVLLRLPYRLQVHDDLVHVDIGPLSHAEAPRKLHKFNDRIRIRRMKSRVLALAALSTVALCAPVAAQECPVVTPVQEPGFARRCTEPKDVACGKYKEGFTKSNRCTAERQAGLNGPVGEVVDLSLFGQTDCRTSNVLRPLSAVTMIVIHNGGRSATANARTWQCRLASAHYTIERTGKVFQHIGEERVAYHAIAVNNTAIGIELNHARKPSCNTLGDGYPEFVKLTPARRQARIDVACSPTAEQYQALKNLINNIVKRTSVIFDEAHVVSHCEVDPPSNAHRDPRGFDWNRIGLSNEVKRAALKRGKHSCDSYHFAATAK